MPVGYQWAAHRDVQAARYDLAPAVGDPRRSAAGPAPVSARLLNATRGLRLRPKPEPAEFPPRRATGIRHAVSSSDLFAAVGHYGQWLPLHDRPFDHSAIGATRPTQGSGVPPAGPAAGSR
jgi:hypothetical protein